MASVTSLNIPEELRARLAEQAAAAGKSTHAYMLEALMEKADRADRYRELASDTETLWEYKRTGVAYAMEDVEQYILGIAAGRKPRRPNPGKNSRD